MSNERKSTKPAKKTKSKATTDAPKQPAKAASKTVAQGRDANSASEAPKPAKAAAKVASEAPKRASKGSVAPKLASVAPKLASVAPKLASVAPKLASVAPKLAKAASRPAPRIMPPPLPAIVPRVDVRAVLNEHGEALLTELERFAMRAGVIAEQHALPVPWEEIVAFRRSVARQIVAMLDRFGPAPNRPVLSEPPAALGAENVYPVVDISEIAELIESLRPPTL